MITILYGKSGIVNGTEGIWRELDLLHDREMKRLGINSTVNSDYDKWVLDTFNGVFVHTGNAWYINFEDEDDAIIFSLKVGVGAFSHKLKI
jgi:hypothetical protein